MRCWGAYLSWLDSRGMLDLDQSSGERVTPARVRDYLQTKHRGGSGARTLVTHAAALRDMLEALAPEQDWTWMLRLIRKLKSAVRPTDKHYNLPSIRELFQLGIALMDRADNGQKGTLTNRALMYRNGLAIALLASRAVMRRSNLAAIRIGQHLIKNGPVYRLQFTGAEMKGRRARGGPLPAIPTDRVERYMAYYRPALLGVRPDAENALWISQLGRPIGLRTLSREIGKVTEAAFGRRICTHEFRHAAATSIAKEDPAHVGIATTILGHAHYRTTEQYYIFAEGHAAFKRLDEVVERLTKGS
jgi:integrase/recombinase XerD